MLRKFSLFCWVFLCGLVVGLAANFQLVFAFHHGSAHGEHSGLHKSVVQVEKSKELQRKQELDLRWSTMNEGQRIEYLRSMWPDQERQNFFSILVTNKEAIAAALKVEKPNEFESSLFEAVIPHLRPTDKGRYLEVMWSSSSFEILERKIKLTQGEKQLLNSTSFGNNFEHIFAFNGLKLWVKDMGVFYKKLFEGEYGVKAKELFDTKTFDELIDFIEPVDSNEQPLMVQWLKSINLKPSNLLLNLAPLLNIEGKVMLQAASQHLGILHHQARINSITKGIFGNDAKALTIKQYLNWTSPAKIYRDAWSVMSVDERIKFLQTFEEDRYLGSRQYLHEQSWKGDAVPKGILAYLEDKTVMGKVENNFIVGSHDCFIDFSKLFAALRPGLSKKGKRLLEAINGS